MRKRHQDRQLLYAVQGAAQRRDTVVASATRQIAEAEADLKAAVQAADANGCARSWIAEALGVSRSGLYDLYQLPRRSGGIEETHPPQHSAAEHGQTAGPSRRPGAPAPRQGRHSDGLGL